MTAPHLPLNDLLAPELEAEPAKTRRMLKRLPGFFQSSEALVCESLENRENRSGRRFGNDAAWIVGAAQIDIRAAFSLCVPKRERRGSR